MSTDPLMQFLAAAEANPHRPAVIEDGRTWTYAAFLDRVTRLAGVLAATGVEHPRVVINLTQTADAYAAMFATLMAGGYYCPLNITHPVARRAGIVAQFAPDVIIANKAFPASELGVARATVIDCEQPIEQKLAQPRPVHHLAYVMFTSGSTGEPKGVMVGREGLGHYALWARRAMALTAEDRWPQHPNIGFDLSVLDIYGAFCSGAALVPITSTKGRLAPATVIREHRLTIWNSVPSVIDLMIRAGHVTREMFASLRLVTFCGEPLLREHLDAIFTARPDLVVHNTYGPTEATVSCTLVRLDATNYRERCRPSVSLGVGIEGMHVGLDTAQPDVEGAEGEIVITGPQVAFGYWNRPELTRNAFTLSNEAVPQTRSYRTGDWGQLHRGELYFLSRTDRQIKRHGYRIELGDIDAVVRQLAETAVCTVHVKQRLITFVEGAEHLTPQDLIPKLGTRLPPYMLPDEIRHVAKLPRNANDKIDASALARIAAGEEP